MCGIAGIFCAQPTERDPSALTSRMLHLIRHRGPDDQGVWGDARVALGNCRLSILDLSAAGHQPMRSAAGALSAHTPRPNRALIYDYLAFGKLEHTAHTFFDGIDKVPPAHTLIIERDGSRRLERYWDFQVNPEVSDPSVTDAQRAERFRAVFL